MSDFFYVHFADVVEEILLDRAGGEATFGHFFDCLFFGPVLDDDSIGCAHYAGAIDAAVAMREDRRPLIVRDDFQKANDIFGVST